MTYQRITFSEPRLETGKRDKQLFKSIIKEMIIQYTKMVQENSHKNSTNALDFLGKINDIRAESDIEGVIAFTEKVIKSKFIVMTAEEKSDKILLFKTVNARGSELTREI